MFRLATLFVLVAAAQASSVVDDQGAIHLLAEFTHWVKTHGKQYESKAEEALRWKVWSANHGTFVGGEWNVR